MPTFEPQKLTSVANRGRLLDLVVFVVNVVLMFFLTGLFRGLRDRSHYDRTAQIAMLLFCVGLVFLQPIAGLLKRRRAHERVPTLDRPEPTFLFSPFFAFLSKLIFLIAGAGLFVDVFVAGGTSVDFFELPRGIFLALFFGIPALAGGTTASVYFYFWKPKRQPLFSFLETPGCERLGDVLLFLNMIGYQAFWGLLMADLTTDYTSIIGRLFMFGFSAALIYFPPRLFYLAEDGNRPSTWLWMLLANSPVIVRMLVSW